MLWWSWEILVLTWLLVIWPTGVVVTSNASVVCRSGFPMISVRVKSLILCLVVRLRHVAVMLMANPEVIVFYPPVRLLLYQGTSHRYRVFRRVYDVDFLSVIHLRSRVRGGRPRSLRLAICMRLMLKVRTSGIFWS